MFRSLITYFHYSNNRELVQMFLYLQRWERTKTKEKYHNRIFYEQHSWIQMKALTLCNIGQFCNVSGKHALAFMKTPRQNLLWMMVLQKMNRYRNN